VSVFFTSYPNLLPLRNTDPFFNHQQRKDIQMFQGFVKKNKLLNIEIICCLVTF